VKLSRFNVKFKPRTTIKAQALSDFLVKCMFKDKGLKLEPF